MLFVTFKVHASYFKYKKIIKHVNKPYIESGVESLTEFMASMAEAKDIR